MHAVIRRYSTDTGKVEEAKRLIDEQFLPRVMAAPGFVSYYALDEGNGAVTSVSLFLTKEEAEASVDLARSWVQETAGLLPAPSEVFGGEVFSHGGA